MGKELELEQRLRKEQEMGKELKLEKEE